MFRDPKIVNLNSRNLNLPAITADHFHMVLCRVGGTEN